MPVIHIPNSAPQTDVSSVNDYLSSDNPSFVLLYMDGCGPCSETHPKWKKMANQFSGRDDIGVFDIEMSNLNNINHKKLVGDLSGFPTMRYVKGNTCEDYESCQEITADRSYDSFLKWIKTKQGKGAISHMKGGKTKTKRKLKRTRRTKKRRKKNKRKTKKRTNRKKKAGTLRKKFYKAVIQPTYRATDKMGITHHYVPQPKSKEINGKKKKTSDLVSAEEDLIGITTDSLADGAAVAA
tara:strand:- start:2304 stop:3020 length:717 start_codon:yes stop_codon:yes gene_type:complete